MSVQSRLARLADDVCDRFSLSHPQMEIVLCLASGLSVERAADAVGCDYGAAKTHLRRASSAARLEVGDRLQLTRTVMLHLSESELDELEWIGEAL